MSERTMRPPKIPTREEMAAMPLGKLAELHLALKVALRDSKAALQARMGELLTDETEVE